MTLYAKWVSAVTFNMQDHGTQIPVQRLEDGKTVTKPTDPKADGYTFGGWYKDAKCTTAWDFDTDTVDGPTTLYAKWTQDEYSVTYGANLGVGETLKGELPSDSTKYHYNDEVTVLGNTATVPGKKFVKWATKADGSGTSYTADDTFNITKNTTLYAQWGAGKYRLYYNANGGTGTPPSDGTEYAYKANATVKAHSLTLGGHIFKEWNTKADGTGTGYAGDGTATISMEEDVTLYAIWVEQNLGVTYHAPSLGVTGTVPEDKTKYAEDEKVTVLGRNDLSRPGCSFAGWNTQADGKGTTYPAGGTFLIEGDTDLYAVWTNLLYVHITAETAPKVFDAAQSAYSATVPNDIDHVLLTVAYSQGEVKYAVGTDDVSKAAVIAPSDPKKIELAVGENKLYVYSQDDLGNALKYVYTITREKAGSGGSSSVGGGGGTTYYPVVYDPGLGGALPGEAAAEQVASGRSPKKVPTVTEKGGYTFKGWSLDGKTVIDPKTVKVKELTTFTALYDFDENSVPQHVWYMQGFDDSTFRPDAPLSRSEITAMLSRLDPGYRQGAHTPSFPDVDPGAWYYSYVGHAQAVGLIHGRPDGTFRPDDQITRAEFVTIMCNYLNLKNSGTATFSDTAGHWAEGYIAQLTSVGVLNGYPDGTFRPDGEISRAEAAKIVNRVFDREPSHKLVKGHELPYADVPELYWAREDIVEASFTHKETEFH